jgi:hypothetical protein
LLAADADTASAAIRAAHALARAQVRKLTPLPAGPDTEVVVDIDATLLTEHPEKEGAAPTYKRGFGHHPLMA